MFSDLQNCCEVAVSFQQPSLKCLSPKEPVPLDTVTVGLVIPHKQYAYVWVFVTEWYTQQSRYITKEKNII